MENNEPVSAVVAVIIMVALYGGMMLLVLGFWVVWIVALVDVVRREFKEPNAKLVWVLVIALTQWLGALIYLAIGRKQGWLPGERPGTPGTYGPPPVPPSPLPL